jgi:hypothetical protein
MSKNDIEVPATLCKLVRDSSHAVSDALHLPVDCCEQVPEPKSDEPDGGQLRGYLLQCERSALHELQCYFRCVEMRLFCDTSI